MYVHNKQSCTPHSYEQLVPKKTFNSSIHPPRLTLHSLLQSGSLTAIDLQQLSQPKHAPKTIEIIYFKAGNGHVSTAKALKAAFNHAYPETGVILTDVYTGIKGASLYEKAMGTTADLMYNQLFKHNLLQETMEPHRELIQLDEDVMHPIWEQHFAMQFTAHKPDIVISVIPGYNRTLSRALLKYDPKIPYIQVATDYNLLSKGYSAAFTEANQYAVCPSDEVFNHCVDSGTPRERILKTHGLVVHPALYNHKKINVAEERQKLGLDAATTTGLIMFGGIGTSDMPSIAKQLSNCKTQSQYIFICGSNHQAKTTIESLTTPYAKLVLGFTDQVEHLMSISDFFVGKPGGLSITEAMLKTLPMLVQFDETTSPLEFLNAQWLFNQKVAAPINNMANIHKDVDQLLKPHQYQQKKAVLMARKNFAVFDVVKFAAQLHHQAQTQPNHHNLALATSSLRQPPTLPLALSKLKTI